MRINLANEYKKSYTRTDFETVCHALKLHCDVEQITNMEDIHIVSASRDVIAVTQEIERRPLAIQNQIMMLKKILTNKPIKTTKLERLEKVKKILIETGFSLATN